MLAESGVRWIRMDLNWAATEKIKGEYNFSAFDHLLKSLEPYNIRTLFILAYGNPLYDGGLAPHSHEGRQAFARWAAAAAKHFSGRGILWEIWNESNDDHFWKPQANVKNYIKLVKEVGKHFKKEAPKEIIIGPAASRVDLNFFRKCFQGSLLEIFSAVTVHPYRWTKDPETATREYGLLKRLIHRHTPKGKSIPIIAGEWGYSSSPNNVSRRRQGDYLSRMWLNNLLNGIPLSIWYDWQNDGPDPNEREHNFGLVENKYYPDQNPVFTPKPAYLAVKTITNQLAGFSLVDRIPTKNSRDYLLHFKKGDLSRWVIWTTSPKRHSAKIPIEGGEIQILDNYGTKIGKGRRQGNYLWITPMKSPQYIIQDS